MGDVREEMCVVKSIAASLHTSSVCVCVCVCVCG